MNKPWIPPPPIKDPICDEEDDDDKYDWYYGDNAGGLVFWFGKYDGYKLRQVTYRYINGCRVNLTRSSRLQNAIPAYLEGLESYAKTNYEDFIVPFGKKHQGQTIAQCRDKPWFRWILRQRWLRDKHPYFMLAVHQWLAHPHHQGVHRDIGELLDPSEYTDDLDLRERSESDDEVPTREDIGFLDDRSEGSQDDGSEAYEPDSESAANTSAESELIEGDGNGEDEQDNEADTSLGADAVSTEFTESNDSGGESEAPDPVPSTRVKRPRAPRIPHPATQRKASPKSKTTNKSKFVKGQEYSDDSDDLDDVGSFINDGSTTYEDSTPTAESGASSPDPPDLVEKVKQRRKRITKGRHSDDEENSPAGPSSRVTRSRAVQPGKTRKGRHADPGVADAAFDSDHSDPPEVHLISSPSKSLAKKTPERKGAIRKTKGRRLEDEESPHAGPSSRTLRSAVVQPAKSRKGQRIALEEVNDAFDSDHSDPPEVSYLSSPTKSQPKKTPKARKGSPREANQERSSSRRHLKTVQYDDSPLSTSPKQSLRAARRSVRNAKNTAVPDDTSSNGDSEHDSAQADEEESRNEIDSISSEPTAESSDNGDASESKSAVHSPYPSPPLTEVSNKRRKKKRKTKPRTTDLPDFVVPDEMSADESDDFQVGSTAEISTPEPTTPRYKTRASAKKSTSPERVAGPSQTPTHRCYVELPPSRQYLSNKKATSAAISKDVVKTSRVGGLKRSRNVVLSSSEDEYSEGTKRPRLSPINLPYRPRARHPQSDMETIDGSVDGETVIRGSSLGLSGSSPSKSQGRPLPSKPRPRKNTTLAEDDDNMFSASYGHNNVHERKRGSKRVRIPEQQSEEETVSPRPRPPQRTKGK